MTVHCLNCPPGDFLPRPVHAEKPGCPLQEDQLHPLRHLVSLHQPVVVVEDHDGGHHRARHHEHDCVEVSPFQVSVLYTETETEIVREERLYDKLNKETKLWTFRYKTKC